MDSWDGPAVGCCLTEVVRLDMADIQNDSALSSVVRGRWRGL